MGRKLLLKALLLLLISVPAPAAEKHREPLPDRERNDVEKVDPCLCCQQCKAAMKPVPEQGEKKGQDGCQECCDRCGESNKPQETSPPDILQKDQR